jgi:hypothetical protein
MEEVKQKWEIWKGRNRRRSGSGKTRKERRNGCKIRRLKVGK